MIRTTIILDSPQILHPSLFQDRENPTKLNNFLYLGLDFYKRMQYHKHWYVNLRVFLPTPNINIPHKFLSIT